MRRRPVENDGFTLVEVLVAMVVLALLASGVASLLGMAARALAQSRTETTAVLLAHRRVEQLRSLAWGFGSAYMPAAGADSLTDLSGPEPDSGGIGLAGSPSNALDADTRGFVDYLDRSGRWLARTGPPIGTRFIRRWSVDPVAGWPDIVMLRVRVIDRFGDVRDVMFSTLRARTAG